MSAPLVRGETFGVRGVGQYYYIMNSMSGAFIQRVYPPHFASFTPARYDRRAQNRQRA